MASSSDSDEDYLPGEPEKLSEEESADEETDLQYEREFEDKVKKRKAVNEKKNTKKRKTVNGVKKITSEIETKQTNKIEEKSNSEEEKKREEDLWAKFLEGTDSRPKPKESNVTNLSTKCQKTNKCQTEIRDKKSGDNEKAREKRIFEFAGETIVVEDNIIKEKIKTVETPATGSKLNIPATQTGSGLSNVLGQLNKKNKITTLEKSKLDWETYKKEEGIDEEIQSHNKGKGGYLDRQDFLERADLRQYEIERDLRMSRRSNR